MELGAQAHVNAVSTDIGFLSTLWSLNTEHKTGYRCPLYDLGIFRILSHEICDAVCSVALFVRLTTLTTERKHSKWPELSLFAAVAVLSDVHDTTHRRIHIGANRSTAIHSLCARVYAHVCVCLLIL